jgi:hypothetical protein
MHRGVEHIAQQPCVSSAAAAADAASGCGIDHEEADEPFTCWLTATATDAASPGMLAISAARRPDADQARRPSIGERLTRFRRVPFRFCQRRVSAKRRKNGLEKSDGARRWRVGMAIRLRHRVPSRHANHTAGVIVCLFLSVPHQGASHRRHHRRGHGRVGRGLPA